MKAAIIGAPLDRGAGRRGVDMGPSAIRYAGLEERLRALGVDVVDRGNVATPIAEATTEDDERARFLPAIAVIGARELDPGERELVAELGLPVHTMSEVDGRGIEDVVSDALRRAAGAPFVHVSLDMDALDPDVAPGVGTAERGGLTYREAHLAMELVAESGLLGSLEIVEVNPILDRHNATASLAVELAASAFGARTP